MNITLPGAENASLRSRRDSCFGAAAGSGATLVAKGCCCTWLLFLCTPGGAGKLGVPRLTGGVPRLTGGVLAGLYTKKSIEY